MAEPALLLIGAKGDDRALKSFLTRNGRKYQQMSVLYKSGTSDRVNRHPSSREPRRGLGDLASGSVARFLDGRYCGCYTRPFGFSTRGQIANLIVEAHRIVYLFCLAAGHTCRYGVWQVRKGEFAWG